MNCPQRIAKMRSCSISEGPQLCGRQPNQNPGIRAHSLAPPDRKVVDLGGPDPRHPVRPLAGAEKNVFLVPARTPHRMNRALSDDRLPRSFEIRGLRARVPPRARQRSTRAGKSRALNAIRSNKIVLSSWSRPFGRWLVWPRVSIAGCPNGVERRFPGTAPKHPSDRTRGPPYFSRETFLLSTRETVLLYVRGSLGPFFPEGFPHFGSSPGRRKPKLFGSRQRRLSAVRSKSSAYFAAKRSTLFWAVAQTSMSALGVVLASYGNRPCFFSEGILNLRTAQGRQCLIAQVNPGGSTPFCNDIAE